LYAFSPIKYRVRIIVHNGIGRKIDEKEDLAPGQRESARARARQCQGCCKHLRLLWLQLRHSHANATPIPGFS